MHVFVHMVCALVKPTIMARKMVRARRGTDPKRPAEPRRAERRHDREAAREHIGMTQSTIVLGSAVCFDKVFDTGNSQGIRGSGALSPRRLEEIPALITFTFICHPGKTHNLALITYRLLHVSCRPASGRTL